MLSRDKASAFWRRPIAVLAAAAVAIGIVTVGGMGVATGAGEDDVRFGAASVTRGNQNPACIGEKAFENYLFYVGTLKPGEAKSLKTLLDNVKPGAVVTWDFKLKPGCDNMYIGLDAYESMTSKIDYKQQKLVQRVHGFFGPTTPAGATLIAPRTWRIQVTAPACNFQIDAYTNATFTPGDFTGGGKEGFISGDFYGTGTNCTNTPATTPSTAPRPVPTTQPEVEEVVVRRDAKADASQVCREDAAGFNVKLTNDGTVAEEFTIRSGGEVLDTVTVPAGQSATESYTFEENDIAAGESLSFEVVANDKVVATETVTNDCTEVEAEIDFCVPAANGQAAITNGAVLSFINTGKLTETFNVTRNGQTVQGSPVSVPAGSTKRSLLAMAEDEVADVVITSDRGNLRVEEEVTNDCVEEVVATTTPTTAPTEVLGETVTAPQLAETGSEVTPMLTAGSLLLLAGAALIGLSRRRSALSRS